MKTKILMVFVLMAVLTFSTINLAQAAGTVPPTLPAPNVGNETQPFKERLE